MSLSSKLARHFPAGVRSRGTQYFHQGLVRVSTGDESSLEARVLGTEDYFVCLSLEGTRLHVVCTCPYFEDRLDPCKHLWAAVLAAEKQGALAAVESIAEGKLAVDVEDFSREDDADSEDSDFGPDYSDLDPGGRLPAASGVGGKSPHREDAPGKAVSPLEDGPVRPVWGTRIKDLAARPPPTGQTPERTPAWREEISSLRSALQQRQRIEPASWSTGREIFYLVNVPATLQGQGLVVDLTCRDRKKDGEWGKTKSLTISTGQVERLSDPTDRWILSLLCGARDTYNPYQTYQGYRHEYLRQEQRFRLLPTMEQTLVKLMCRTDRCRILLPRSEGEPAGLNWVDSEPWQFRLEVRRNPPGQEGYKVTGALRRGLERKALLEPVMLTAGGLVFFEDRVEPLDDGGAFPWIPVLRREERLPIPAGDEDRFLEELLMLPWVPALDLPEELRFEELRVSPRPVLKVHAPKDHGYSRTHNLRGDLLFDYEGVRVPRDRQGTGFFDSERRVLILRDEAKEQAAASRLPEVGFRARQSYYEYNKKELVLSEKKLPFVVETLTGEGWLVEAEGRLYRKPGDFRIEVTTGIDWFELRGDVSFDDQTARLPELLAALKRGQKTVLLDDGTLGLLPEEWLARWGIIAEVASVQDGSFRFSPRQMGWLDALIASQPEATFDEGFRRARERLTQFQGVERREPPESFRGRLRGYQQDGLGWFRFLEEFGFGGCLADDMGLGKTVQALALLEARRFERERGLRDDNGRKGNLGAAADGSTAARRKTPDGNPGKGQEAGRSGGKAQAVQGVATGGTTRGGNLEAGEPGKRQAPPGTGTHPSGADGHRQSGEAADTVLASIASLEKRAGGDGVRTEVANPSLVVAPKSVVFNWLEEAGRFTPALRVLDYTGLQRQEAFPELMQYDLVVTTYGTLRRDILRLKEIPFDYVILDEAQTIKNAATQTAKAVLLLKPTNRLALSGTPLENHLGELWSLFEFLNPGLLGRAAVFQRVAAGSRLPDEQTRGLLNRALRPFILRRTKAQVVKELPEKTEQTIQCEMGPGQQRLYQELREHYRRSLLGLVDRTGLGRAKIQILEALLRLRQAACHPALIDPARDEQECAKLEALLPRLTEVLEEGHKALVFSQFTRFLGILRRQLDRQAVPYAYLDGKTRDRASVVQQFQDDPECRLFLISLKAGGLGLNLTAATYVFLLDPWWNPAVEAQAIDRTHRIGQTLPVFAYRLITRDTVEEKILELQETKRDLAESIITADNSLIRRLSREDLELLLS